MTAGPRGDREERAWRRVGLEWLGGEEGVAQVRRVGWGRVEV